MIRSLPSISAVFVLLGCPDPDPNPSGEDEVGEEASIPPCSMDAQEPDDSHFAATAAHDFEFFMGTLCTGDEDWFTFSIAEPSYVGISAQYDGRLGDLDFELRAADSGSVVTIANGDEFEYYTVEAIHRLATPGDYEVRVHLDSDADELAYEIRFHLLPHG